MDRREFSRSLIGAVASYALMQTLVTREAFGWAVRPITDHWVRQLHTMSLDLKTARITPRQWQDALDVLYRQVPPDDLLRFIDFDRLIEGFTYPDLGVNTRRVPFPSLDGIPEDLAFHRKIFGLKKDRAIIPHGHKNMVSCHYVLHGEFRLKHYDKIEEDATHMLIEPTVDDVVGVGSFSSISDEHQNIHWLKALTDTAFTFDVLVLDLGGAQWDVDNIDPYGAERVGERLRVRKLPVEEALTKYGHDTHH